MPKLALAALGVVFGDIGTSPLYAMRACLTAGGETTPNEAAVLGVLSLIFWAIALTVTWKYVLIVLRNDNRGEGGVLALTALLATQRSALPVGVAVALGLMGTALFYGDGSLTPAVSVLSAVEGLKLIEPAFEHLVVPITAVVLFTLFFVQKRGTGAIGVVFGPVMLTWFVTLGLLGLAKIIESPGVLVAANPAYAFYFMLDHGALSLAVLAGAFLAVTGGEALFADLGHFGRKPIQTAWLAVVWPGLLLNYFGQGALLLQDPSALRAPFYLMAPPALLAPLVLLAAAATVIASQAVISGVFSLSQQALQLGFLPRMRIEQTSAHSVGQVYVPVVNWVLCAAALGLVFTFRSSDALASAYGIAVASTMVIETALLIALLQARRAEGAAGAPNWMYWSLIPLGCVDLAFFIANVEKIPSGGWFPLLFGGLIFLVMRTWQNGRVIVSSHLQRQERSVESFLTQLERDPPVRVPGTAVFMTSNIDGIPRTLARNLRFNGVMHEMTVIMSVTTERIPRVPLGAKLKVIPVGPGLWRINARVGFMERPEVPRLLKEAERSGLSIQVDRATYFLGRDEVVVGSPRGMAPWRKVMFLFMARNAQFAGAHFGLPPGRIVEVGGQVQI